MKDITNSADAMIAIFNASPVMQLMIDSLAESEEESIQLSDVAENADHDLFDIYCDFDDEFVRMKNNPTESGIINLVTAIIDTWNNYQFDVQEALDKLSIYAKVETQPEDLKINWFE